MRFVVCARVTVGDLTLIPPQFVVRGAGPAVRLGPVEFGVLSQLMANPGKVVSHERILDEVWGHRRATTRTLKLAVQTLRAKIGDGDPLIDAAYGAGFVLRGPGVFLDPDQDGAIRYADVVLNPLTQSAKRGDRPLTLSPAWFAILNDSWKHPAWSWRSPRSPTALPVIGFVTSLYLVTPLSGRPGQQYVLALLLIAIGIMLFLLNMLINRQLGIRGATITDPADLGSAPPD